MSSPPTGHAGTGSPAGGGWRSAAPDAVVPDGTGQRRGARRVWLPLARPGSPDFAGPADVQHPRRFSDTALCGSTQMGLGIPVFDPD